MQQLLPVPIPGPHVTIIASARSRAWRNNYYQYSFQGLMQQLLPVLIRGARATIITRARSRASFNSYYQCLLQGLIPTFLPDGLFLCLRDEEAVNELRDNLFRLKISAAETRTTDKYKIQIYLLNSPNKTCSL